jgi:hypothetical protein
MQLQGVKQISGQPVFGLGKLRIYSNGNPSDLRG